MLETSPENVATESSEEEKWIRCFPAFTNVPVLFELVPALSTALANLILPGVCNASML